MKKKLFAFVVISVFCILTNAIFVRAQSCVQPASNMVSWWKAEGNGADVRNLNNGTLQNGTTFAAGNVGQAFNFDGLNDAILLGTNSSLQPASITIEAWINKNSVPAGLENIFAKWGFDATVDSYLLGVINDGGTIRAFGAIGDGTTGDPGLLGGSVALNTWTHIAMTYNSSDGTNKLFLNGVEVASRNRPNGIFPTVSNTYFGREDSTELRYFTGLVDELAVYSRALSPSEIQAIFNAGTAGKCTGSGQLNGNFSQKQKLLANMPTGSMGFGNAVAIDGDTMVVGASNFDTTPTTGINIGKAYVFVRNGGTWTQQAELQASDGAAGDEFGYSVAISGDTIVVGSWRSNAPASNSGAAYVFVRSGTTWTQQQKLTANDGAADDEFGNAVAISGDTVAVGSHSADQPSGNGHAGAVYIYNRSGTTWTQAQKLIPTGTILFGDFLGESVAISGNTLVAGAPGDDEPQSNAGTVYVYTLNSGVWTQAQKIMQLDGTTGDGLGSAVAVDGNTIIASGWGDTPTPSEPNRGSVFVYVNNGGGWSLQQKLTSSDAAASDYFGWSLAVRGDRLIVGARHDDTTAGADAGSAYVFTRNASAWTEKQKLAPNDSAAGDRFGSTASLYPDGTLVIGAPEKNLPNGQGNSAGAVYVFNTITKPTLFDFDGDSKTDISIFRPSVGQWWYLRSSDSGNRAFNFGNSADKLAPGDYTGDGKTDICFFRPSDGFWYVLRSEDSSFFSFPFGANGDIPAPADYDGDGRTDPAVFRPSTQTWFINRSTQGLLIVNFGFAEDKPIPSDFDGDGKADIAVFRPSVGQWWYLRSSDGGNRAYQFGLSTDKPVVGDYTGDGKSDIAFWRPSDGFWYILRSEDDSFFSFPFGTSGDIPAPGDYDGDGKTDPTVFRPSSATWFVNRSTSGLLIVNFGFSEDRPVPNAFVP